MFKHMKLGTKIITGFALLIVIACALGGVAVWQMRGIQAETTTLAKEFVPEVKIANNLERYSLKTMYAMRGYGYTGEDAFLKESHAGLAEVKKFIKEAKDLSDRSPHLVKLKGAVEKVEAQVLEYERLANETVARDAAIEKDRKAMDEAATAYMKNCDEFLKSQEEGLAKEIEAGAEAAKLKERYQKIQWMTDVVDLGNGIRLANFKAQGLREPGLLKEAVKGFEDITRKLDGLKAITRQDVNLKQLEAVRAASKSYKDATSNLLVNWEALERPRQEPRHRRQRRDRAGPGGRGRGDRRHRRHRRVGARGALLRLHPDDQRAGRGNHRGDRAGDLHHPFDHRADPAHHRRAERGGLGSDARPPARSRRRPSRWPRARPSRRPRSRRPPPRSRRCPP